MRKATVKTVAHKNTIITFKLNIKLPKFITFTKTVITYTKFLPKPSKALNESDNGIFS